MKKMQRFALSVCAIFFLLSLGCTTSGCRPTWDWNPDPYSADHTKERIISADRNIINCNEPIFSDYWCFSSKDMADLKYNIDRLNVDCKVKRYIRYEFNKIEAKVQKAKANRE